MGWMYTRALSDPDGHILEVAYMDMAALGDEQVAALARALTPDPSPSAGEGST